MMLNVAYNATDPNVGLELSSDHHSLKCFLGDTVLLVSMAFGENELIRGEERAAQPTHYRKLY